MPGRIYYDFHIHSCLSPCGAADMTVNNIVNMAVLKGLNAIALTDNNSSKNCPAFLAAAKEAGIKALSGMEITTLEEVHAICLFKSLDNTMAFDSYVYDLLPDIKNRPEIFGDQTLLDEEDQEVGHIDKLLLNALPISFYDLSGLMEQFGGIYFPAHIDKPSFSLLSNLGFFPPDCPMSAFEIKDISNYESILSKNPAILGVPSLINSDAHYLWDISEPVNVLHGKMHDLLKDWLQ
jgi:PHP family Zn ribbon phosphoesterase